jgi:glutamate carboxypeptidase
MVGARELRRELAGELPAMLEEIERLASIDSGSYDVTGVDAVADGFGELFAARGFEVTRTGHELTARRDLGPGPTLLVLGHADTVWAEGWPVTRDGDWLRGPGVGDMKGCVVMAAHALGVALEHRPERLGAVEVLIVPDEELGSPASRAWIEDRARAADACLGLEAGWPGGGVVVARGAVGALYVTARGRTAHVAAHEDEGASAVSVLAPLVAELEAGAGDGAQASVGVFRGGTARQVVPGEAELHVDLRAPDAASADALLARVHAAVAAAGSDGVELQVRGGFTRPPFDEDRSRRLWSLAQARAAELGIPLIAERSRGGSDASFAAALGVETLDGLGPICHDSCARGERIEIGSLVDRGALLAGLVLDVFSGPAPG